MLTSVNYYALGFFKGSERGHICLFEPDTMILTASPESGLYGSEASEE